MIPPKIAKITPTDIHYIHQDHLGSATRITDSLGDLAEQTDYMPFGQMRDYSDPPALTMYKYTDQELDLGTGLYNYDARLYDPIIGRFISADSIVPDFTNPQCLNRYSSLLSGC